VARVAPGGHSKRLYTKSCRSPLARPYRRLNLRGVSHPRPRSADAARSPNSAPHADVHSRHQPQEQMTDAASGPSTRHGGQPNAPSSDDLIAVR
jgi:hypothetical protein